MAPFVLATDRGRRRAGRRRSSSTCRTPAFYVGPCIAGHVGADTAAAILAEGPHRGEAHATAGRRRHQRRDRARRPRPPVRRVEPDRSGVRGGPDQLRPAGDGRRHRAGAHRPGDARAAVQGDRLRRVVRRARLRRGHRDHRRDRRLRLGHHRRHRRDVPRRDHRRRRAPSAATSASARRGSSPDGRTFAYVLHDAASTPAERSRRTTCGRSSWPRPRCGPASTCSSSTPGIAEVDRHPAGRRVRRPHRPGARDGARARARLSRRRRAVGRQRRRCRRRAGAAVAVGCGPRWRRPCAA